MWNQVLEIIRESINLQNQWKRSHSHLYQAYEKQQKEEILEEEDNASEMGSLVQFNQNLEDRHVRVNGNDIQVANETNDEVLERHERYAPTSIPPFSFESP